MSLLRCRALLSVPGPRSSVYLPSRVERRSFLSSPPFSSLTPHIPRSLTRRSPILYLLYRRDQSRRIPRACAARNERSPVSCLSFRPSVQRTGRPVAFHAPYSSLLERSPFMSLFLLRHRRFCPLFFARLAPSLFHLVTVDRDVIHIQIHADQVAPSSRNEIHVDTIDFSSFF